MAWRVWVCAQVSPGLVYAANPRSIYSGVGRRAYTMTQVLVQLHSMCRAISEGGCQGGNKCRHTKSTYAQHTVSPVHSKCHRDQSTEIESWSHPVRIPAFHNTFWYYYRATFTRAPESVTELADLRRLALRTAGSRRTRQRDSRETCLDRSVGIQGFRRVPYAFVDCAVGETCWL